MGAHANVRYITQDIILFTLTERFTLQKLGLTDQPHGNELACREQ